MSLQNCDEDLRNCLTHQSFRRSGSEASDAPEISEEPLSCSIEDYVGLVSGSSLSYQAAAIRRMQARRQKFSAFMPK